MIFATEFKLNSTAEESAKTEYGRRHITAIDVDCGVAVKPSEVDF